MSSSSTSARTSQAPEAFTEAFSQYLAGSAELEAVAHTLADCLNGDLDGASLVQALLFDARDRGALDDVGFETLMVEIDRVLTEDIPTAWSEESTRDTSATGSHDPAPVADNADPDEIFPAASALAPGALLKDRFTLQERVSEGAMGQLFKALDRRREEAGAGDSRVAIKVVTGMPGRETQALRALRQEAANGQRLTHENIVRIFDIDRDGPHTFMSMEWLDGESLARILDARRRRPMPRVQALHIIEGACRGLAHTHASGMVHADVKPGNIFVTRAGHAKLLDFGVAQGLPGDQGATVRGHTPEYASCEVLSGLPPAATDDLFSLACVAYRMLAGKRVFGRRNALQAEAAGQKPERIESLSPAQWRALDQALAFRRADRQPDVNAFLSQLKGPREDGTPPAEAVPPSDRKPQLDGQHRKHWMPLVAGTASLALGLAWWFGPWSSQVPEPVKAGSSPSTTPSIAPSATMSLRPITRPPAPAGASDTAMARTRREEAPVPPPRPAAKKETDAREKPRPPPTRVVGPDPKAVVGPPRDPDDVVGPQPPPALLAASSPEAIMAAGRTGSTAVLPEPALVEAGAGAAGINVDMVPFSSLRLRNYVEPSYPRDAAARSAPGWVDLAFTVATSGRTTNVVVIGADPPGRFEDAAVSAVRRWRFAPVRTNGAAAEVRSRIRVRFQPE